MSEENLSMMFASVILPFVSNLVRRNPSLEDYGATINTLAGVVVSVVACFVVSGGGCALDTAIVRGLAMGGAGAAAYPLLPRNVQAVGLTAAQTAEKMSGR